MAAAAADLPLDRPYDITSEDIDVNKITMESMSAMRAAFPTESDTDLARFLIARTNDVTKAKDMLAKHLEWKSKSWPILKSSVIGEFSKGKIYVDGFDKEGHPLVVWRAALNVASERDLEELGKVIVWWMEYAERIMPKNKSKVTIIIDRTDFSSSNNDIEFIKHLATFFQDNYPERMYRAIVYPSGLVFYGLWNVVKWFLDPITAEKVQPIMYYSGVQSFIEDQYIPKVMGGQSAFVYDANNYTDSAADSAASNKASETAASE